MGKTSATAQTYNDTNVIGQIFSTGSARNTGQFLAAIGGLNGARRVKSQSFDMGTYYSLDTATQNVISENTSLSAGTPRFYARTPKANVVQVSKYDIAVSDLREAANWQVASTTHLGDVVETSEFDRAASNSMDQLRADWEFACLQGTYVARSTVATDVAMGGLVDSTIGISTNSVNASSAALDITMIEELLATMAENGSPMSNLAIVVPPGYMDDISTLYGFAPQDRNVGGVAIKQIYSDFGEIGIIWTNAAPANNLIICDLTYCRPVVLPHKGGIDVLMKEYMDGSSAEKGYVEGFIGVDFFHESYHGKIYGIA